MTSVAKLPVSAPARIYEKRPRVRLSLASQLRALVPTFVYGFLLLALAVAVVFVPMHARVAADPDPIVRALLGAQLFRLELWLAPIVLLCGSVAAVFALLRARRMATSMARLQEGVARLAVSDSEPISFPSGDDFHALEAPLAGVVKRIDQLTRGNLEMLRFFRRNLEGIAQRAANHSDAEIRESVQVLIRDVDAEIKKLQLKS